MKVKAYCGHYIGASYWRSTEVYEPDECFWEGIVEVDDDEWEEGHASATCPICEATLWQGDSHLKSCTKKE